MIAPNVVAFFIQAIQTNIPPTPTDTGWVEISLALWERARWVDEARLLRVLGNDLHSESLQKDAATSAEEVVRRVLRLGNLDFAATVDGQRFMGLIDRRALLDRLGKQVAEEKS
jgi:hypothetical protein